ncbi:pyridoxamine 5'-phosphate oxidase [Candidatus Kapabacteria bacterium]|nr:pyridoxamine 5'-phosphate oxidase [Candidatus Kapabacteria bacterium]
MGFGAYENLRKDYNKFELLDSKIDKNPINQFELWFSESLQSEVEEPNAMAISTVSNNIPSTRIVLLKGVSQNGFIFYTNYDSEKGLAIENNPNVSLLFFWDKLHRQIRINGTIQKISRSQSVQYFDSRPYESKIGALASNQSKVAASREEIENRFKDFKTRYPENPPCPENWGGFIVEPTKIEFWQGRTGRLHDRIVYEKNNLEWSTKRLYP